MMKKEKPKNGTDAVSKRVVTNITPRVIGKKKVNSKKETDDLSLEPLLLVFHGCSY